MSYSKKLSNLHSLIQHLPRADTVSQDRSSENTRTNKVISLCGVMRTIITVKQGYLYLVGLLERPHTKSDDPLEPLIGWGKDRVHSYEKRSND